MVLEGNVYLEKRLEDYGKVNYNHLHRDTDMKWVGIGIMGDFFNVLYFSVFSKFCTF